MILKRPSPLGALWFRRVSAGPTTYSISLPLLLSPYNYTCMADSSSFRGKWRFAYSYILRVTTSFIIVQIRSLLKITNNLIDTCYESYDTLAEESDKLIKLSSNLQNLFKVAATNGGHSLGIGISVDELLSRYKNEISETETLLKQKSLERIKGCQSSSNPQVILTGLASSTNAPKGVVEENFQYVCTLAKKFNADNIRKGPLLEPVLEIRRFTSTVSIG